MEEKKTERKENHNNRVARISAKHMGIILSIELIILLILSGTLIDYSQIAPEKPKHYPDTKEQDLITSENGKLCVNKITVQVPNNPEVEYSIAYSWKKEDKDYPSAPTAAVASYRSQKATDDIADAAEGDIVYEISLYKDAQYSASEIPEGKTTINWFAAWDEEETSGLVKKRVTQGNTRGFLVSTLDADDYPKDYKTYTFSFAIPESGGIAVYSLEGLCYEPSMTSKFKSIMESAANSIYISPTESQTTSDISLHSFFC